MPMLLRSASEISGLSCLFFLSSLTKPIASHNFSDFSNFSTFPKPSPDHAVQPHSLFSNIFRREIRFSHVSSCAFELHRH